MQRTSGKAIVVGMSVLFLCALSCAKRSYNEDAGSDDNGAQTQNIFTGCPDGQHKEDRYNDVCKWACNVFMDTQPPSIDGEDVNSACAAEPKNKQYCRETRKVCVPDVKK